MEKKPKTKSTDTKRVYRPYSFSSMPEWLRKYYATKSKLQFASDKAKVKIVNYTKPVRGVKFDRRISVFLSVAACFGITTYILSIE